LNRDSERIPRRLQQGRRANGKSIFIHTELLSSAVTGRTFPAVCCGEGSILWAFTHITEGKSKGRAGGRAGRATGKKLSIKTGDEHNSLPHKDAKGTYLVSGGF